MNSEAQVSLHINIDKLPPYHPAGADLYMAGSMNGWNPEDSLFRFSHTADGKYEIKVKLTTGPCEFKITRGSWATVQCQADGKEVANNTINLQKDTTLSLSIAEWHDRFAEKPKVHTVSPHVQIMDTAFWMPQLGRTRRIWIYIPEDYLHNHYPVMYLHDGQNLFDEATSYAGEWALDEFMDSTRLPKAILVGIDNGGVKRMNEYNPYDHPRFGKGEGRAYVDFIVQTLKPWIDTHYPTKKDKLNTFIAGSSMGGLISMQALIQYPDVFGGAGVFSPSFWIAPGMKNAVVQTGKKLDSKIYFYVGGAEDKIMVSQMNEMDQLVQKKTASRTKAIVAENASHNEEAWKKAFPAFYQWMIR